MEILEQLINFIPWIVTYCLLLAGLIGSIIPFIPSHLIILIGAIAHYFMLKDQSGIGVVTFIVISVLMVGSQVFETMSGSLGSKWFGGTKWGTIGALIGMVAGIFFAPWGFILGPLVGALVCEKLLGKQGLKEATASGIGSSVGILTGIVVRVVVAILMVFYLLLDIYLFKP